MRHTTLAIILMSSLFMSEPCAAEEKPMDPAVPIIVVHTNDSTWTSQLPESFESFGTPVVAPSVLAGRLGLLPPPDKTQIDALREKSENAKNLFFKGDHRKSREGFENVIENAMVDPSFFAFEPNLRRVVFNAMIFAAWCSRELGEEDSVEILFSRATETFPDLKAEPADFPPWIRQKHSEMKSLNDAGANETKIEAPHDCEIYVDGALILSNRVRLSVDSTRKHSLFARCFGRRSPVNSVTGNPYLDSVSPLVLKYLTPDYSNGTLTMTGETDITDAQVAVDAASVAAFGNWSRAVVIVSRKQTTEFLLVETANAEILRRFEMIPEKPISTAEAVSRFSEEDFANDPQSTKGSVWYKDSAAWTLLGSGLAVLGTGLALSQANDKNSSVSPFAWALVAAGGSVAGTGIVLFFIPRTGTKREVSPTVGVELGLVGTWHF